jgi:medium-chain acyl-[acyl-carrier-protein] hydrolase
VIGTGTVEDWLPGGVPDDDRPLLLCFPHAGAGTYAYAAWHSLLPDVAVRPVRLPGRETRFREAPYRTVDSLVEAFGRVFVSASGLRRQLAVYGHSMGALVAFEFLRWLRDRGELPPRTRLFVSGRAAPHLREDRRPLKDSTDDELIAFLRQLGGTPNEVITDPTAREMFLPLLRADFALHESHRYHPAAPLPVPVTVFGGSDDPRASPEELAAWRRQTSAGFAVHLLSGGHFAVFDHGVTVTRRIAQELQAPC